MSTRLSRFAVAGPDIVTRTADFVVEAPDSAFDGAASARPSAIKTMTKAERTATFCHLDMWASLIPGGRLVLALWDTQCS